MTMLPESTDYGNEAKRLGQFQALSIYQFITEITRQDRYPHIDGLINAERRGVVPFTLVRPDGSEITHELKVLRYHSLGELRAWWLCPRCKKATTMLYSATRDMSVLRCENCVKGETIGRTN